MSDARIEGSDLPNPFHEFLERYSSRPVLFVQEVLSGEPDVEQSQLLDAVARGERRIAVRSGHGVGKTTVLAWAIVWWACTRFPQKTVCTAPTSAQLFDALASETKTWFKKLPPQVFALFELQTEQIRLRETPEESFVAFRTSRAETPEAMAGVHSANVLLIGDEASGIPQAVFDAGAGSMSGYSAVTILAGNPVRSSGLFYDAFHDLSDRWWKLHISCIGHPRVTPDFCEDIMRRNGEFSNEYRVRVLGEFPLGDDDTVIPMAHAQNALTRDVTPLMVLPIWGVDCARFGSDASALAQRRGNVLICPVEEFRGIDTMQLVGRIKALWDVTLISDRPSEICVDVIGIGAGVCDRLNELGLPARGVNVSESPSMKEQYANLRAELWFLGAEWLAKRDCNLANDTKLVKELIGPRYSYTSSGKKQVETKQEMKKRGKDSPNRADAFLLTLASDAISASAGPLQSLSWKTPLHRQMRGIV